MLISALPNTSPSILMPSQQKTFLDLADGTALNAPNGLRVRIVWNSTLEANHTNDGRIARIRNDPYFKPERCVKLSISRLRALKEEPYNQKEADAAIGLRTDNGSRKPSKLTAIEEQAATLNLDMDSDG